MGRSHILLTQQQLPLPPAGVFPFFADASNLERITPPELQFHIITPGPIRMQVGTLIEYRLRLFGVPFAWLTRISHWDPPHCFVDEQLLGPYRQWVHTHHFQPHAEGTLMIDRVVYQLPFFPLGELALPLVRRQLKRIFSFRRQTIAQLLAAPAKRQVATGEAKGRK